MRVTLYKLQDGTEFDDKTFRDNHGFRSVEATNLGQLPCKLYIKPGHPKPPKWTTYLSGVVTDANDLAPLYTQSSSAVLLVKHSAGIFAVAFGNGFQAIDPAKLVRGFGLRVTANAIAKVKSADTRGLNREGKSQRVVMPVSGSMADMGIEISEDWVRQLSGEAVASSFATTAAGADSLKLSIKDFTLSQLPAKLDEINSYSTSDDYKERFSFIDNFIRLETKDPLVAQLDELLATEVINRNTDIFFAAPEPFEQIDVDHYQLVRNKKINLNELNQSDVYEALDQVKLAEEDPLRKITIAAMNVDDDPIDKHYKLYDYIQAELTVDDDRFVLSAGIWFRVSNDYVAEVQRRVDEILDLTGELDLPTWTKKPSGKSIDEGDYNDAVADERNYALLDKDNLHFGQQRKVEVCDLLTAEKRLLCVKRATRSSTLSHLFAQGSVSAALMYDENYQQKLKDGLTKVGAEPDFGTSAEWTIVYAIGTEKEGTLAESLFFFSKLNLITHVDDIRGRSIKVAVARIQC